MGGGRGGVRGAGTTPTDGLPCSTEVFICTSPLMKYEHCVGEKVRLPQASRQTSLPKSCF